MSLMDKQLLLLAMEQKLGDFIPANEMHRILAAADEALADFEVTSAPTAGPDGDSEDLLRYFLDAKRIEGKSDKTVKRYEYILRRLLNDTGVPFARMTVYQIRNYYSTERERGIASSTLEGNRTIYRSFFGWLSREGLIKTNPMQNLTAIKQPKVVRTPFSPVEIEKLENAATEPRDRALLAFLLATGCRVSEVCGADRERIDWQQQRITVLGKGNKERVVLFDDVTAMYLKAYLDGRADADPALFTGRRHERLTTDGVRLMLKRLEKKSGVENVHPHRFRRTRATTLIDAGMQIQDVACLLGHEKLDTTMRYVYIDERNVANSFRKYA